MKRTLVIILFVFCLLFSVFGIVYNPPKFNYGSAAMTVGINTERKMILSIESSIMPLRYNSSQFFDAGLITQWTVGQKDLLYLGLKVKIQTKSEKVGVGAAVALGCFNTDPAMKLELYQYAKLNDRFNEILIAAFDFSIGGKKQFSIRAGIQM